MIFLDARLWNSHSLVDSRVFSLDSAVPGITSGSGEPLGFPWRDVSRRARGKAKAQWRR